MMEIEDKSQESLSDEEQERAKKLGLSVITCAVCKRPSLWMKGSRGAAPLLCGRLPCLIGYGVEG